MYKRDKHKKTTILELLLFAASVGCLYYAMSQTSLKLWQIILAIFAVILTVLSIQILILYRFKQRIKKRKNYS